MPLKLTLSLYILLCDCFTELSFKKNTIFYKLRFSFDLILVPSGIRNITFESKTAKSVKINWLKPEKPNGKVSYLIKREINGHEEVMEESLLSNEYQFLDLEEFSNYTLSVKPCTKAGCGNSASIEVQTDSASMYLT